MKKNKKRVILVISFLIVLAIYAIVNLRGEYLKTLGIGQEYIGVFEQNLKYKLGMILTNFVVLYILTYITTKFIHRGLRKFFVEEKIEMPKLPNKSICLIFSVIIGIIASGFLAEKAMMAINVSWFGIADPIFNIDIGYYIFQKPFIEAMLIYFIVLGIIYTIYIAAYYIVTFNVYFDKGIDPETLKKNTFLKHIITNIILIVLAIAGLTLINTQNVLNSKFLNISSDVKLFGSGLVDSTVKVWGYRIFAIVIPICVIMAIKNFKKENFKKVMIWLSALPIYLVILFVVMLGFDLLYVNRNELDKEKTYIENNIAFTKKAYDIEIDEIEISNTGTITTEDVNNNQDVVDNINLLNENNVLEILKQYQSNSGYYSYNVAIPQMYNIDGQEQLIYVSPREIVSNDRTYNNKTYEYTHGYGIIATSASAVDENGNLAYVQSKFESEEDLIKINEPRIYFGLETNSPIITNAKNKQEFDYPLTSTNSSTNIYNGEAGLKLNFIDRIILAIEEGNMGIAFSGNVTKDSKIITTRNIIERAKVVMPYLKYDSSPYLVVTDNGDLMWVLDAYTTSNYYPYSQETIIEYEGLKEKINYIRNSVKVLIDPYNGDMNFYIVDETDPIAVSYSKIYDNLFKKVEEMPKEVSKHILYPEYLYNIQAEMLKQYHNVQPEVLYRQDDAWDVSKENTTRTTSAAGTGTNIIPYYTKVKTINNNESDLGLVVPYTIEEKQNIISYLVGTYDENNNKKLTLYKFKTENAILGTTQLDTLVEQDENISKELNALNITGTKLQKNIIVVPINNTLLYVEPVYQIMLNDESQIPLLKKVVVASGNKVAIGDNIEEALENLLSQEAIKIEVHGDDKDDLIEQIINANNNLEQSNQSNDWEMIGKDMAKLQELIGQLETMVEEETKQKDKELKNTTTENNISKINIISSAQ